MLDKEVYEKVSQWFDQHQKEMIADIKRLVSIPSISEPGKEGYPFGKACKECLEEMLKIGREHGFYTENYENRVGSIGSENKNWQNMIGLWNHMDVVPTGHFWIHHPFEPIEKDGFLIGRGAQDNKGPAIGILYVMQCLRELKFPLKHELCLFVGSDEEREMEDLEYYVSKYPTPKMSMIADSGFPVCYGEKGIIDGEIQTQTKVSDKIIECGGGNAANMIPDQAFMVLSYDAALEKALSEHTKDNIQVINEGSTIRIKAIGRSKHSAFPEGSINAIYELMAYASTLKYFSKEDRALFHTIAFFSEEFYGKNVGITYQDEVSGATTCAATVLTLVEGKLTLHLNLRYAITHKSTEIDEKLSEAAAGLGVHWKQLRDSAPNYFPKEYPAVQLLTDVYNKITGDKKESFVMGGGTYARKLPNSFAYGIGGMQETKEDKAARSKLFPVGHGGAHEPDEGLNLRLYFEAMKIYTMAIMALNDCEL